MLISALHGDEAELLRELRLAALGESPDAFSPTLAETEPHPMAYWRAGAQRFADNDDAAMFIVRPAHGLVSATLDGGEAGNEAKVGHIGAMWVDPRVRGQHLGSRLLDTAMAFLLDRGAHAVVLSVTETNTQAIALYQSRGFALTGEDEPLREGSSLRNLFMRCETRTA